MIEIEELFFSFHAVPVLHKIDLKIQKGEFIGIIGPNGGGKTTLLKILMGFLSPSQGTVYIDGRPPSQVRQKIGYVPQIHRMDRDFPITVWELILLGALSKIPAIGSIPQEIEKKALELLDEFGLSSFKNNSFASLSGGLAQRALFVRALLSDPEIILLDEPTANVDAASTRQILLKLDRLKREKTILIVTHDLRTIVERVDRILCVEGHLHSMLPQEVCEHFALGLYHTPLLDQPKNHLTLGKSCGECPPR